MALLLEIVTPQKRVYSESVDSVVLPTKEGQIDVLPGHIPLMGLVEPGELIVMRDGKEEALAVSSGFVQVQGDKISVLAEEAIHVSDVEAYAIDEARQRAEEALEEAKAKGEDPELLEELETKARYAVAQKIISERKKG
jgi:F-type H+-transporting ATPase subunit epsilon